MRADVLTESGGEFHAVDWTWKSLSDCAVLGSASYIPLWPLRVAVL